MSAFIGQGEAVWLSCKATNHSLYRSELCLKVKFCGIQLIRWRWRLRLWCHKGIIRWLSALVLPWCSYTSFPLKDLATTVEKLQCVCRSGSHRLNLLLKNAVQFPSLCLGWESISLCLYECYFSSARVLLLSACSSDVHRCAIFVPRLSDLHQPYCEGVHCWLSLEWISRLFNRDDTWLRNKNVFYIKKGPVINFQCSLLNMFFRRITFFKKKMNIKNSI